jgi:hypothetical protein
MQELRTIQEECEGLYEAEQRFEQVATKDPRLILPYTRSTVSGSLVPL